MIPATSLELFMLVLVASSHELRTKVCGVLVWIAYFQFSASRALLARFAQWLHDRNNPPGGPA